MKLLKYVLFLLLLPVATQCVAQNTDLGLLPPQVYFQKVEAKPKKSVNAMAAYMEKATAMTMRNSNPIPVFTDPLLAAITAKAPRWLRAAGAKNLAVMTHEDMSADERETHRAFNGRYSSMTFAGTAMFGVKKYNAQVSAAFRDQTNEYADLLERDYLVQMDMMGTRPTKKKTWDERVDPKEIKGNYIFRVSFIDAATGVPVHIEQKTTWNKKSPVKITREGAIETMEKLVLRGYPKFLKKQAR